MNTQCNNISTALTASAAAASDSGTIIITLNPHDRRQLATTVEKLINLLDDMDGDPDLEPEEVEEQHDREDDPADYGIAGLKFMGEGTRAAEALLATHLLHSVRVSA